MKYFHVVLLLLLLMVSGCSLKEYRLFQGEEVSEEPTVVSDEEYAKESTFEYKIQANDRVSLKVFNQVGSSQQITSIVDDSGSGQQGEDTGFLVTQKGTVHLPLIGSIKIAGLTEDQAAKFIIDEYKTYLRNPYAVVEIKNQRIIVLGEVTTPGVVPITNGTMSLLEVIARSGDMTDWAMRTHIVILRGDLRKPEIRVVDLTRLSSLAFSSLYLHDKDIVYIQPRSAKGMQLFTEEVTPPFTLIATLLAPFVLIDTLRD